MKFSKIFAIALAALTLTTACSDDVKYNTAAGVTVELQDATMKLPEDQPTSATYYQIPVQVVCTEGKTNGPIKVTISISEPNSAMNLLPAKDGENFVFTDKTITIPAGETMGYFEMYPKGDTEANKNRGFMINITAVEGAKVGAQASCLVTLVDNELMVQEVYEKLPGTWTLAATDLENEYSYDIEIEAFGEESPMYRKVFMLKNIGDMGTGCVALATFSCDPTTETTTLNISNDQLLAPNVAISGMDVDIRLYTVELEGNSLYLTDMLSGTSDSNLNKIVFPENLGLYYWAASAGTTSQLGVFGYDFYISMTRVAE